MNPLEEAEKLYDEAAKQLDLAARHCEVTAAHFRDENVPRAAAHAWAAFGHLREAERLLEEQAREHSRRSSV